MDISKSARALHWSLQFIDPRRDLKQRNETARKIIEAKDEEQRIYQIIDHWMETGEIRTINPATRSFKESSDLELLNFERNVKTYVTQYQKKVADLKRKRGNAATTKDKQKLKARLDIAMKKLDEHRANLQAARVEIKLRTDERAG